MNENIYIRYFFYFFSSFLFIINFKIISTGQEINITIVGTGKQQIVYNDTTYYDFKPNKILINGILQQYTDYFVYDLNKNINVITMIWDNKLSSCFGMFFMLSNITDIDFSNFDTSNVVNMRSMFSGANSLKVLDLSNFNTTSVKTMYRMFFGCTSLVSVKLNNFDTSQVGDMNSMFYNLNSLKTLDLSNFNTPNVKDMQFMFGGCISLVSLNLNNFDTSQVEDMHNMFSNLNSLKTLDLSNFNTCSVKNMEQMFYGCTSLVSLNLSNFDTSQVTSFNTMFYNCSSLIYLNLNSFIIKGDAVITQMLNKIPEILLLCYNTNKASKLSSFTSFTNQCSNDECFKNEYKLIINYRACIKECNIGYKYIYEYKNICFETCLEVSEYLYGNSNYELYYNYDKTKCIDEIPDGYYLNDTNEKTIDKCNIKCKTCNKESNINNLCLSCNIQNNYYPILNNNINSFIDCYNYAPSGYAFDNLTFSYKPCYSTCKECIKIGDNFNHQCSQCIDNYYLDYTNCYKNNCTYYYYFDESHVHHCTENKNCPENKNKLIFENRQCIDDCSKDKIFKYEYNNSCFKSCSDISEIIGLNENYIIYYDNNEKECKFKISNDHILNYTNNNKNDIIDTQSIILGDDNDKNIEYMRNKLNNSYIKESELEEIKNGNDLVLIENNELKMSLTTSDNKINQNKNTSRIDLGECENELKNYYNISKNDSLLILKVEVMKKDMKKPRIEYEVYYTSNENKLYKLDLDKCDDINIIISNPMKLDGNNIDKYNSSSDFFKDICYPYTTENGTDMILNDRKEEFINNDLYGCEENCNFTDYDYENNMAICSCKVKKELRTYSEININKTLLYKSFTDIKTIMNLNVMKCFEKLFCKNGILHNYGFYIILFIAIFLIIAIIVFYSKEYKTMKNTVNNIVVKKSNNIKNQNINENLDKKGETKKNGKKITKKKSKKEKNKKMRIKSKSKRKNYSINLVQTSNNINNPIMSNDLGDNSKSVIKLNDRTKEKKTLEYIAHDLNDLDYSGALKKDKRTFKEYYSSIVKEKYILYFSFCKKEKYNSRIIKIYLFFYSFVINLFVNTLFFNDKTMHKIYTDLGIYNLAYQISQILYSLLISTLINIIIKTLALTENNILDFINKKTDLKTEKTKLIKFLSFKFAAFFIISIILLLFFWYYISSFCAIYINTQIHLITDTIISFGLSMVYPLLIYLLSGILRILALKGQPNKNRMILYNINSIIQLL